jgi:5-methylcytosine-specific restriction protein A
MRAVPEWIGKDDGTAIPQRVRLRVYNKFGGTCQICFAKEKILGPEFDHRVALINGGKHAESNLVPVHPKCHKAKTRQDVAEKSATYRTQSHHLGIKKSRNPMPGSKASGWRKRMDGRVERR